MNPEEREFIADLYQEMYTKMYNYAYNKLDNPVEVDDIVQDTFLIACTKSSIIFNHANPQGWLIQSLKNMIRNHLRVKSSVTNMLINVPLEVWLDNYFVDDIMIDNIDLLYGDLVKYKEYELLKKFAIESCPVIDIAHEYGISISCCKLRLFRNCKKYLKT